MKTKFIFALKALEKELDRQILALFEGDITPDTPAIKHKISLAYLLLARRTTDEGYIEDGLALCRKAVQANPDNLAAVHYLLTKMERLNRVEEAWVMLNAFEAQCSSLYDTSKNLYLLKAHLEYRRGNLETSRAMLERFIVENPRQSLLPRAYGLLGKTLDGLNQYDLATKAFHECNKHFSNTPEGINWIQKSKTALANLTTSICFYQGKTGFGWQDTAIPDKLPAPVLLVGFPRSGTTLLEQILNTHTAITTLGEKPTLSGIANRFYGSEEKLLLLSRLSSGDIAACRQLYWSNAEKYSDASVKGLSLVDKLPLNIMHLDIFTRLFPKVKIVVVLRNPNAVVLSNYMQMYRLNPEMATSLNLAGSAQYYAKVMALYLLFRKFIPHNIHEIRYEDVVFDFEDECTKLLEFLELKWDNKLWQYHEQAKQRWITTPSYEQVIKPIYSDAVGRWQHYEAHLEAIKPVLQPFVESFGY